ncbi:hypothetical protein OSB04_010863 [Centaurea solstitialis]|uniref:Uncharacterized protein n=1 Tax=Centaurea solstitialis TaxID=347529 RepID=A0AA38WNJ8_9ASTR|nr:hypothetical protein OSB04_010863 [Centaurea solstitialis]
MTAKAAATTIDALPRSAVNSTTAAAVALASAIAAWPPPIWWFNLGSSVVRSVMRSAAKQLSPPPGEAVWQPAAWRAIRGVNPAATAAIGRCHHRRPRDVGSGLVGVRWASATVPPPCGPVIGLVVQSAFRRLSATDHLCDEINPPVIDQTEFLLVGSNPEHLTNKRYAKNTIERKTKPNLVLTGVTLKCLITLDVRSSEPVSVLNPITETESSSNTLNEETVLSPSQLSSTQPFPETAVEAVREQTVSTVLAPIPEVVPPPSPSRTYSEVVREPCPETVLNTDPDASLHSSAIRDENDSRNNMEYDPIPHSRKWTRSHSTTNIIGSPSAPVTTRSSKKDENLILFGGFLSQFEPTKTRTLFLILTG